jgi:hypothetical protein
MDESARRERSRKMEEIVELLGRPGVYDFWADEILEVLRWV